MFDFSSYIDLPLVWAVLIAVAVLAYVVLDGFDLGIGVLFPFAPSDNCRDSMMNAIAPFWDGNETWLILGGGGMLAVFPLAFSVLMPALYIPIIVMLIALIFRGVAFEFRYKADMSKKLWDVSFHFGSLLATFAQGVVLGTFVQGIDVEGNAYAGGPMEWLTPFALLTGVALVFGYALLGATWTIKKTEGQTKEWARRAARYLLVMVMVFMGLVSLWVPFLDPEIAKRWFAVPNIYFLALVPVVAGIAAVMVWRAIDRDYDRQPFFLTILLFVLAYLGLGISLFPYIVPRSLTIWDAASNGPGMSLMLVGALVMLPVIFFYVGYCYWIFRGKTTPKIGYQALEMDKK
jgi:cytochrome bd ubiquinol oxidase subunit II